jgi:hypothetical protein
VLQRWLSTCRRFRRHEEVDLNNSSRYRHVEFHRWPVDSTWRRLRLKNVKNCRLTEVGCPYCLQEGDMLNVDDRLIAEVEQECNRFRRWQTIDMRFLQFYRQLRLGVIVLRVCTVTRREKSCCRSDAMKRTCCKPLIVLTCGPPIRKDVLFSENRCYRINKKNQNLRNDCIRVVWLWQHRQITYLGSVTVI